MVHGGTISAQMCRSLRAVRWRTTALPTALDTTSPALHRTGRRRSSALRGVTRTTTTEVLVPARAPERSIALKSWAFRMRCSTGSIFRTRTARPQAGNGPLTCRAEAQALSSLRPLRRRAEMIDRPARVRMRDRKPCLRLRRRLLGWKVRLVIGLLPNEMSVKSYGLCSALRERHVRRHGAHITQSDLSTLRATACHRQLHRLSTFSPQAVHNLWNTVRARRLAA